MHATPTSGLGLTSPAAFSSLQTKPRPNACLSDYLLAGPDSRSLVTQCREITAKQLVGVGCYGVDTEMKRNRMELSANGIFVSLILPGMSSSPRVNDEGVILVPRCSSARALEACGTH